jgi:hypothetical protein
MKMDTANSVKRTWMGPKVSKYQFAKRLTGFDEILYQPYVTESHPKVVLLGLPHSAIVM